MKNIILAACLCTILANPGKSQAIGNVTETNTCSTVDNMRELYAVLDSGKVVVVTAAGYDCSICMGEASGTADLANRNKSSISFWGAMNFKYSSSAPTCNNLANWRNNYGWNNIFMFNDGDKSWADGGYPTYTVIDPKTKTIALITYSSQLAINKAKELAAAIVTGITEHGSNSVSAGIRYEAGQLFFYNFPSISQVSVFYSNGLLVNKSAIEGDKISLNLIPGAYFVRIQTDGPLITKKLVVNE